MVKKIIQVGESDLLRETAKKVPIKDIGTKKINTILDNMKKALSLQDDGVAIAAPQIGVLLRIFVVAGKTFAIINDEDENNHSYSDKVFINPIIKKISRKKEIVDEGCLSVRGKYGKVSRAEKTTIIAYDECGKKFKQGASGLLSQIFQHEIDHLSGILFIDKATEIEEI